MEGLRTGTATSRLLRRVSWRRRPSPIVIGGCARSGTTLLLSILSSHPQIAAIPVETQTLCPTAYWGDFDPFAPFQIDALQQHLDQLELDGNCRYWCEKTPRNILFFERLVQEFGRHARLIHVVRDGRDVVCSRHPDAPQRFWVSPARWIADVRAGVTMDAHPQVFAVRYEDLVTRFTETITSLSQFLNLDLAPEVMAYPEHAQVNTSNAWYGKARPLDPSRISRWKADSLQGRANELVATPAATALLKYFHYL